jgi:vancomycin resistance protein YoaR
VRSDSPIYSSRARQQGRSRSALVTLAVGAGVSVLIGGLLGLAFAGSRQQLAEGTQIAGVEVGGLTHGQAVAELEQRFSEVAEDPVEFTAGERTFSFAANQLGVDPDWRGAVQAADRAGDGFGPIRGFRRLHTRFFGAGILPRLAVSNAALEFALDRMAAGVDRPAESAALVRRGLRVEIVPELSGQRLVRDAAAQALVRALGSVDRVAVQTVLPVVVATPRVTAPMLSVAARRARTALSAPVVLRGQARSFRVPRWRIAELLALPSDGRSRLTFAGPPATAYFRILSERVGRPPADARFAVSGDSIQIVPAQAGTRLDVPRTARAMLRAATSRSNRIASISVVRALPELTTKEALAMGIDSRMASYKTYNAGTWDRITNLRLGVTLLDDTLVAPGGTFSLNEAIGERTEERGFRSAPVIIGTKYAEEVGGGTSQVATTVFNAAWEAGLKITERNPHSLYISRYQLGRDATVYWPSLDLKFVNDTSQWVLVKGFAESDGVTVSIYGGERRRVESSQGTFQVTGAVPVQRIKDKSIPIGERVVEEEGTRPSRTSVTRTVYSSDGSLISEETWNTSYRGETRVVRVGTKPKPKAKAPEPKVPKEPANETPSAGATTPPATRP